MDEIIFGECVQIHKERLARLLDLYNIDPSWINEKALNSQRKRHRLYIEAHGKCCFCKRMTWLDKREDQNFPRCVMATAEHIRPRSQGGLDQYSNLDLSCNSCNSRRGIIDYDEFMVMVETNTIPKPNLSKKSEIDKKLEKYYTDPTYRSTMEIYFERFPDLGIFKRMKERIDAGT
jgi:hypothetical protein